MYDKEICIYEKKLLQQIYCKDFLKSTLQTFKFPVNIPSMTCIVIGGLCFGLFFLPSPPMLPLPLLPSACFESARLALLGQTQWPRAAQLSCWDSFIWIVQHLHKGVFSCYSLINICGLFPNACTLVLLTCES